MTEEAHKSKVPFTKGQLQIHARLWRGTSRACSTEARTLVESVLESVTKQEMRERQRSQKTLQSLRDKLAGLLGDLLLMPSFNEGNPYVSRSMSPRDHVGSGWAHFRDIIGGLAKLSFVEVTKGFQRFGDFGDGEKTQFKGAVSRFKATDLLWDVAAAKGITPANVQEHFRPRLPEQPIELRTASRGGSASGVWQGHKVKGKPMTVPDTKVTKVLRRDVQRLNAFLDGVEIRGAIHHGYRRLFNLGDLLGFRWQSGGRLYSAGHGTTQQISQEKRLDITLNGEPVCELDFRASHLTIWIAMNGGQLDQTTDPYRFEEFDRGVVKTWITGTIGHGKPKAKWSGDALGRGRTVEERDLKRKENPATKVRDAVLARYPLLSKLTPTSWADITYLESNAVLGAMLALMDGGKVPSLAVYDSLLVPLKFKEQATHLMEACYEEACGAVPFIRCTSPDN